MTSTLAPLQVERDYRSLFLAGDWDLVTFVIRRDPMFRTEFAEELQAGNTEQELADRVLVAAIEYLHYCDAAEASGGPSERVDIGWHALILCMRVYEYLCERLFGRILYHEPISPGSRDGTPRIDTAMDMARLGFPVDDLLVSAGSGKCKCDNHCTYCQPNPPKRGGTAECVPPEGVSTTARPDPGCCGTGPSVGARCRQDRPPFPPVAP
jgi:hypothetical protein